MLLKKLFIFHTKPIVIYRRHEKPCLQASIVCNRVHRLANSHEFDRCHTHEPIRRFSELSLISKTYKNERVFIKSR